MATPPETSSPSPGRHDTLLVVIVGLVLATVGWFAYTTFAAVPPAAAETTPLPWPSVPPTVTPRPSAPPATPIPTPTPLPTPAIERIARLATLAHTFEVIVDVTPEPGSSMWDKAKQYLPGEDHIVLATTWKASYGVDLKGAQVFDPDSTNKAISFNLPPITVLSVEQVGPVRPVIISQQAILSQAPELVVIAQNRAQEEARSRSGANQEMLGVAADLTRLRLEDWMRELGYTSVTVNFDSSRRTP